MKLWNQHKNIDSAIEQFTIGDDPIYDMRLAKYDVIGSLAHAEMLHSIDYLTDEEYKKLSQGLNTILGFIENGDFSIDPGVEDIHSQVEFMLTEMMGEVGKKIHVGRSRNDQIAVDLKLYYRDVLNEIKEKSRQLAEVLLEKADSAKGIFMPGYTHSQAGMVSSFGLWYSSFAESLADDINLLSSVQKIVDQNPLGSAAGYGSSLPNDREMTTRLLKFTDVIVNPIQAQASRGKAELHMAYAISSMALTINRLASDICIYSNENYKFLSLPDKFTTGSSIMPHKKNPDVLELVRAKCNQLSGLPTRLQLLLSNMQTGYHRDFQLLKEIIFPELDKIIAILDILIYCIPEIEERENIMDEEKYKFCYTVEVINDLVKKGTPFRDAYHEVKKHIADGSFTQPSDKLHHTHLGSIGNLGLNMIRKKINKQM